MERIVQVPIEEEMKQSYLDYAMSVIVGRALPDVRDGLKPVHRRILYAMYQLGLYPEKPYKKSARIVGETLGKFHPHGDTAVYDALVRMAQDFSMRYPLIDGQGNFGSVDGDSPAAMRYTEARLSKIAKELLRNIEKDTVDFRWNFDESLKEPEVLPARFPNLLVNGASGIAVGMATNIPPHNLKEVCLAVKYLVDRESATVEDLMKFIKGPDFPTGAEIISPEKLKRIYETGRGSVTIRAKYTVESTGRKNSIVITELPYQVNKAELLKKIADLVKNKKIEGIADIRDESDRDGIRVVIELKRDATPQVVLNRLFKFTPLQTVFNFNMIALVNGEPALLNLKEYLQKFIEFRREVIVRRTSFELRRAERRLHILDGLKTAIENLERVVSIVRSSESPLKAKERLVTELGLSDTQAEAILDMKLQRLTALERAKIEEEREKLKKDVEYYRFVLSSDSEQRRLIKEEMDEIIEKFGDERRTAVVSREEEIDVESMIEDEEVIIFLTHKGFVARASARNYKIRARDRAGVLGLKTREGDFVKEVVTAFSKDYLLVFTTKGKVYWLKAYEIPSTERSFKGTSVRNFLPGISGAEGVSTIIPVKDFKGDTDVLFVTRSGYVKRTSLSEFSSPRVTGITAISLGEGDRLVYVDLVKEGDSVLLISSGGRAIRFGVEEIRRTGRTARGVRGMLLPNGDTVVAGTVVKPKDTYLLVVTERGYGKRVLISEFPVQKRGGKGIIVAKLSQKTGKVASAVTLKDGETVVIASKNGKVIRVSGEDVPVYGRHTRGVRIQRLSDNDSVVSVSKVEGEDDRSETLKEGTGKT